MSDGNGLVPCSDASPLFGLWMPHAHLNRLFYGPSCAEQHLLSELPCPGSRVFIVTGRSLATKTPLIRQLEALLGEHHAGTFTGIKQHGEAAGVDQAFATVAANPSIDTILSVGGGSPIDAAKVVSFRISEQRGSFLTHVAIPTTLSAAECTPGGGFTRHDGTKVGFMGTGYGAMHADRGKMDDALTMLMLASFASSGFRGANLGGGMGLSHSLGHALGSPYGIPHSVNFAASLEELVLRLGLKQPSLSDRGVGRDQIPIIVERAVKDQEEKELRAAVRRLVEALF
ncbi:maleylacetate reductase [Chaetomium strumarium]|uniref:Maleylacetate reductase n=1 Tax=Chaetomium strumarium TaxID=1170767 RepID=A0AAJ0M176_9PEZI|nr:maleylacetate reductase [Chaetomium strumarium]